jgi:cytochrome b6-f complex iron-sulfur subunit
VPWNRASKKFMCPCHGSQYSKTGAVVRGPAPLPLALEHVEESADGKISLKSWTKDETDFRTNGTPWWNF